jgi:hypothetical protein
MRGAASSLIHTSSWSGARLSRDKSPLFLMLDSRLSWRRRHWCCSSVLWHRADEYTVPSSGVKNQTQDEGCCLALRAGRRPFALFNHPCARDAQLKFRQLGPAKRNLVRWMSGSWTQNGWRILRLRGRGGGIMLIRTHVADCVLFKRGEPGTAPFKVLVQIRTARHEVDPSCLLLGAP